MKKHLLGLLAFGIIAATGATSAQADRLDQMISPITNPVTFEDPRSLSELRLIYVRHTFEDDFVTLGGNVQVYALQARFAINDRLSIIATKDGYVDFNPDATLPKDEGWANIGGGVKYAFYKDDAAGQIASAALRYEFASGDEEVLQGNGDGLIHPSVSAAFALDDTVTLIAGTDARIAVDGADSSFWHFDLHLDKRFETSAGSFYPLVEVNVMQVIDGGRRLPITDEGVDFFNLGASGADDKTIVVGGVGMRYRASDAVDLGVAYQFPLTSGSGSRAVEGRLTADLIWHFA